MYLDFLISLIIFTIIYFILLYSTRFILKDLSERRYKQIRENLKIPLLLLMLNSALLIPFYYLEQTNHLLNILNHFLRISLIFLSSWFIIRLMHLIRLYLDDTHRIDASNNLKARKIHTQYRILERVFKVLIIFIAIAAALMTFDSIKKIGISLFASAGVASIIIGFSAQKIIASIIAGIQLAIAQPIRVQDVVIVNGEWGWIEEINLTYVVVKVWDRRRLVVPTTYFIDNIFQNWTRKSSFILGTVFLYTDYTISVDAIREELDHLLSENTLWDGKVKVVQVTDASPKTMELRILVSAEDSPTAWELRVYLREKLIKFIQKNYPESLPKTRIEFPENQ
ncbi:mechanosensitive ion channel family protein [Halanaerobium praevalens]|uniref:MscS Mechanosensitive ion channel n=1 Tax=Halanaerobium praevalens (strain ATCC 33744 / DSM 2228 / GSL) TaxID=572479 RepID=E3DM50_HALPG|nr:mechanosensitive ion channel domain-containing protein [Halanaerobium praevalens]ADO77328.1 MscS Mechanosensitive ion channel [Halanaerobium praevalens DSM 2228]